MGSSLSPEEIIDDFKTFYYDTALSTHDHTLVAMKAFVGIDKIVFGTDFPGEFILCFCWSIHWFSAISCKQGNSKLVY